MKKKLLMLLVAVTVGVSLLAVGCAPEAPSEPSAPATPAAPSTPATPAAPAEEVINWRFQTIFSPGQPAYDLTQLFCDNVEEASDGRLNIKLFPNGGITSSMEAFQACGEGVFEMHESWPNYIAGINNVFRPMATANMGVPGQVRLAWIYEGGGEEIYEKAFNTVNLHLISCEAWPYEAACGNKRIKHISDLEGLKFRTGDPRLMNEIGIDAVLLPLEDTFTALQTGAVDVSEFGSVLYNEGLGLTDITKYIYWPDYWNTVTIATMVVNQEAWAGLPANLQKIVETCAKANQTRYWTLYEYGSAKALKRLEDEGKIEVIRLPAEDFVEMRKIMDEIEQAEIGKYGGLTEEFYDSFRAFKEVYFPYAEKSKWWGYGLTVEEQLGTLAE